MGDYRHGAEAERWASHIQTCQDQSMVQGEEGHQCADADVGFEWLGLFQLKVA
jgi:hypothetical protein